MKTVTKKKVYRLSAILAVVMVFTLFSIFSLMVNAAAATDLTVTLDTKTVVLKDTDGDGFYEIGSADALYAFAAAVNSGSTAIDGELTTNITVNTGVLTKEGALNGDGSNFQGWTPIGTQTKPFKGNFNGNNYTVSGLYFNNQNVSYIGLFGNVASNAENDNVVENVGVLDSYFNGNRFIGGVVGSNGATVMDCYNNATVFSRNEYAGGVVGYNAGIVTDSYNNGAIEGNNYVGGVVGANYGGVVTKSYNAGKVHGENAVGGVAGFNAGSVKVCYNIGAISGSVSNIGGVVGENSTTGTIESCYNVGDVFGYPPTVDIDAIGGVVGLNEGTADNCYYLNTCGAEGEGTAKSEGDFISGEVTYLLNGSVSEGALDWYQFIIVNPEAPGDELPQFNKTDYVVYYHPRESSTIFEYSNHKHEWVFEVKTQDKSDFENAYQYTANQLTAYCANNADGKCHWHGGNGGTLTLKESSNYNYKIYNGLGAVVNYVYDNWYFTEDNGMTIRYYACDAMKDPKNPLTHDHTTALGSAPVNAGYYCVEITYTYDSVEYVLQNYYEIKRRTITSSDASISGDVIYDGNNHMPSIWVNIGGYLVKDRDYTVKFYRNGVEITDLDNGFINTGVISVEITGIGNYTGAVGKTYVIKKPNIENDNFYFYIKVNDLLFSYKYSDRYYSDIYGYIYQDLSLSAVYNGQAQKPAAFGLDNVSGLLSDGTWIYPVVGTDYTVKFCRINADGIMEETTDFTNAGEIYVVIEAKDNYEGKVTLVYDIDPAWIEEDVSISFGTDTFNGTDDNIEILYNGKDQIPEIGITVDGLTLVKDRDYTVEFERNGIDTTDLTNLGTITLIIRGIGNYQGWIEIDYTIDQAEIINTDITISDDVIYNGNSQKPTIGITVGDRTLIEGTDYTVKFYRAGIKTANFTMAGEITVVIEGKDSYFTTDPIEKTYTIKKAEITDSDVTVSDDVIFNGQPHRPEIGITVGGLTLVKDRDYTVKFERDGVELKDFKKDFVVAGDITITITGIGNYFGEVVKTFTIEQAEITDEHVTIPADAIYNQSAQQPEIIVKVGKLTLVEGVDYTVSYTRGGVGMGDFTSVGDIVVTITGIGNYCGVVTRTYTIECEEITEDDVYISSDVTYNGSEQAPSINIYVDGLYLTKDYDYTVKFYRNGVETTNFVNAGEITVVIEGINNYIGTVEKIYTIKKAQLSISLSSPVTVVCPGNKILLAVTSNSSELPAPIFNNEMFSGAMIDGNADELLITVSEDFVFGFQNEYQITIVVTYGETDNYFGNTASIILKVRACGDCEEALAALDKALADLEDTMNDNDWILANKILALETALKNAIDALEQADDDNKTVLEDKINTADKALADAIAEVQDNLDKAVSDLNNAITNGDKALSDKIDALDKALADAKATLEATDAANKSELVTKIETADKALEDAIAEVQKNLDDAKAELNQAIINGDKALSDKIDALDKALADAKAALEAADAANKAELVTKIETADKALEDAIAEVQKNLDDAKAELNQAITNGDKALSDEIAALRAALEAAKTALEAADAANKAELVTKIETADKALEDAIAEVQKNLDDAKAELNQAIINGDKALSDKIDALDKALADAKAALEATDAANKAELVTKIETADKALEDAIAEVQKNLDDAKAELNQAITNGDKALSDEIAALRAALEAAKTALEAADAANKAELVTKIETADKALEDAIAEVQKNLDDAKAELNQAITNGDKALSDKIDALDKALDDAKVALEATDSASAAELIAKIEEADAALKVAIDAISSDLNDVKQNAEVLEDKNEKLQTLITVIGSIAGIALCGSGAFITWFFIDRKKKLF